MYNLTVLSPIDHVGIMIIEVVSWLECVVAEAIDAGPIAFGIFVFELEFQRNPIAIRLINWSIGAIFKFLGRNIMETQIDQI